MIALLPDQGLVVGHELPLLVDGRGLEPGLELVLDILESVHAGLTGQARIEHQGCISAAHVGRDLKLPDLQFLLPGAQVLLAVAPRRSLWRRTGPVLDAALMALMSLPMLLFKECKSKQRERSAALEMVR